MRNTVNEWIENKSGGIILLDVVSDPRDETIIHANKNYSHLLSEVDNISFDTVISPKSEKPLSLMAGLSADEFVDAVLSVSSIDYRQEKSELAFKSFARLLKAKSKEEPFLWTISVFRGLVSDEELKDAWCSGVKKTLSNSADKRR